MNCSGCGNTIDEDSLFCRHCGSSQLPIATAETQDSGPTSSSDNGPAKPKPANSSWSIFALVFAPFLALAIIVALANSGGSKVNSDAIDNTSDQMSAEENVGSNVDRLDVNQADETPAPAQPTWTYSSTEDAMNGGTKYFASTTSTNTIHQDAPYG